MDTYLAIDLRSGSGRIMAVRSVGETIELDQVCRFDSPAIEHEGSLLWEIHLICAEITRGLKLAAQTYGSTIRRSKFRALLGIPL